jgi:uncharacterized membrane protein
MNVLSKIGGASAGSAQPTSLDAGTHGVEASGFETALKSMAALTTSTTWSAARDPHGMRFGRETLAGGPADASAADRALWAVEWQLKRNCSMAPRQLLGFYLSLCVLSLGVAGALWVQGAVMVMPFAWLELLVVGALMLLYARHAADSESICLRGDEFTVEHACGSRIERVSFQPAWVRVEPEHGDRSLIELSGQGRRIAVGRFVRPELRYQLAEEFRWALRRWQQRAGRVAL